MAMKHIAEPVILIYIMDMKNSLSIKNNKTTIFGTNTSRKLLKTAGLPPD